DDVRDLYDLRVAIEARAARLVIERGDQQAFDTLHEALDRLHEAVQASDLALLARADYNFHETVCRVSGNRRLLDAFLRNASVMRLLVHMEEGQYYMSFEDVERQHQELLESLEAHDTAGTDAMVVEHLEGARDRLLGYLIQIADKEKASPAAE